MSGGWGILLNRREDYKQLGRNILIRILGTSLVLLVIFILIFVFLLDNNFGDMMVGFWTGVVGMEYDDAMNQFNRIFRGNQDLVLLGVGFLIFLIVIIINIRSFTRYFTEINSGLDALVNENVSYISLSPELATTQNKINTIMQTLEERKLQAKQAEQRKNDLVVYLAHDLKTPLTSVIGYLTLLRDEKEITVELQDKYLALSLDKAEHLEDLINEFFEITRFNLSAIALEYSRVNITRLLEQIIYEFKPMLDDRNLRCNLLAEPEMMVMCDGDKMQRVFDNLLRNAVNYSYEDSEICIEVRLQGSNKIIEFTNVGNTIPEDKLQRIFEQFFRIDQARTSKRGGAGLGLAIAKEIVEAHEGEIRAKSEGEKTIFTVVLPIN